jgi:molybdopterin synthase catalytic subunit
VVEIKLKYDPLVIPLIKSNDGAQVIFQGVVRPYSNGKQVLRLEFEAYEPMALKELNAIATAAKLKWPALSHVLLHHRLGIVTAGEVAVIAICASPHRAEAFSACEFFMNELKKSVPIWKKECYTDGHYWVSSTP